MAGQRGSLTIYVCPTEHEREWRSLWETDRCPLCGSSLEPRDYVPATWLEGEERDLTDQMELTRDARAERDEARRELCDAQHELALLMEAINEHQRACERKVSKAAWGRANGELYRARLAVESGRAPTIGTLQERLGWTIDQTAERLGIPVKDVLRMLRAEVLERVEVTGLVTEVSIRRVEEWNRRAVDSAGEHLQDLEDEDQDEAGE